MSFEKFLVESSEQELNKIAEAIGEEGALKIVTALMPLFEKCAEYTKQSVLAELNKTAGDIVQGQPAIPPASAGDNGGATRPSDDSLNRMEVIEAAKEALVNNSGDKLVQLAKSVLDSKGPQHAIEIIKMLKTVIHSSIMDGAVEEQKGLEISAKLDALVGE